MLESPHKHRGRVDSFLFILGKRPCSKVWFAKETAVRGIYYSLLQQLLYESGIELVLVSRSFQTVYHHQGRDDGCGGKAQLCEESFKSRVKIYIECVISYSGYVVLLTTCS